MHPSLPVCLLVVSPSSQHSAKNKNQSKWTSLKWKRLCGAVSGKFSSDKVWEAAAATDRAGCFSFIYFFSFVPAARVISPLLNYASAEVSSGVRALQVQKGLGADRKCLDPTMLHWKVCKMPISRRMEQRRPIRPIRSPVPEAVIAKSNFYIFWVALGNFIIPKLHTCDIKKPSLSCSERRAVSEEHSR